MLLQIKAFRTARFAYLTDCLNHAFLRFRALRPIAPFPYTQADLRQLPQGSLGKTVADYMDVRGFSLLLGYEQHDIKHVLFGYEMDAIGEVRLQAFSAGLGLYSCAMLGVLLLGAAFLPDYWRVFYRDFERGRKVKNFSKNLIYKELIPLPLHIAQARMGAPLVFF